MLDPLYKNVKGFGEVAVLKCDLTALETNERGIMQNLDLKAIIRVGLCVEMELLYTQHYLVMIML